MGDEGQWIVCEKCRKRLIKRLPNGLWVFKYCRRKESDGYLKQRTPVEMVIFGSLKMTCLRPSCGHINELYAFPQGETGNQLEVEDNQQKAESLA